MSYAFTGRYIFSFSGRCGNGLVLKAKLQKIANMTNQHNNKKENSSLAIYFRIESLQLITP